MESSLASHPLIIRSSAVSNQYGVTSDPLPSSLPCALLAVEYGVYEALVSGADGSRVTLEPLISQHGRVCLVFRSAPPPPTSSPASALPTPPAPATSLSPSHPAFCHIRLSFGGFDCASAQMMDARSGAQAGPGGGEYSARMSGETPSGSLGLDCH